MIQQDLSVRQSEPPHTNRGVEVSHLQKMVFSFDWIRLTIWSDVEALAPLLDIMSLDLALEETGHGGLGFRRVLAGLNGFQIYCDPVAENQVYVSLNLPSKCLQSIGVDRLQAGISWLCEQGCSSGLRWAATRIDLAFDTQDFTVQQFADAYRSGEILTKTRSWNEIKGSDGGHTFYLGSRESTAMLRVYHKMDGHSFGDDAFTRVELELKAERAAIALSEIFAAPMANWAEMAAGWVVGFADVQTTWWADWMAEVKRSWLRLRQPVPTVERARRWLEKQVLPSLAVVVGALSSGDIQAMQNMLMGYVGDGQRRFTKRHYDMIENYQSDVSPEFAVFAI